MSENEVYTVAQHQKKKSRRGFFITLLALVTLISFVLGVGIGRATSDPEIIYRTGDLARRNSRGELEFISRKDYQIKHMGHRIELGEIEAVVDLEDDIRISCCVFDDANRKIVLYYVGDTDKNSLSAALRSKLPRYMLPHVIIKMDALPFTPNGKLDRKLLKEMYTGGKTNG